MLTRLFSRVVLTVVLLVVPRLAVAEDFPSYKLQLQTDPDFPGGKIRAIEGKASPRGDHFFIEAVGILQPVAITLIAQKKGDPIDLALGQGRWDEILETHSTGDKGEVTVKLRTQGELEITVSTKGEPKPYWLLVWVGDEVKKVDLAPVLTPMKAYKEKNPNGPPPPPGTAAKAGGTSPVLYVIAGALVVIIILLVLMLRKRGRS